MRIVEFVGFMVVALALSGWLIGRPHTLDREGRKPREGGRER